MARGTSTAFIARRTATIAVAAAAAAGLAACGAGQVTSTDQKQTAIAGVNIDSESGEIVLRDLQVEFKSSEGYEVGGSAPLRVWISNESGEEISLTDAWIGGAQDEPAEGAEAEGPVVTLVAAEDVESIGQTPEPEETPSEAETTEEAEGEDAEGSEGGESETGSGEETETPGGEETTEDDAAGESDGAEGSALLGSEDIDVSIAPHEFVGLDQATGDVLVIEGLTEPLIPGQAVTVTFEFSNGDVVTANIPVGQPMEQAEPSYQENPGLGGH